MCCCIIAGSHWDPVHLLSSIFDAKSNGSFKHVLNHIVLALENYYSKLLCCVLFSFFFYVLCCVKIQEFKISNKILDQRLINNQHCLENKVGHYKLIEVSAFSGLLIREGPSEMTGSHFILHFFLLPVWMKVIVNLNHLLVKEVIATADHKRPFFKSLKC